MREYPQISVRRLIVSAVFLGIVCFSIILSILIFSNQFKRALESEKELVQVNSTYMLRQIGAEIFRLSKSFERYTTKYESYDSFLIRFDIVYGRLTTLNDGLFSERITERVGHAQVMAQISDIIQEIDGNLDKIEARDPAAFEHFRMNLDEAIRLWEEVSHETYIFQIDEKQAWRDYIVDRSTIVSLSLVGLFIAIGVLIFMLIRQIQFARETLDRERELSGELVTTAQALETALNAKNDFLATMSHELRTPLNAIHGFSQLLGMSELNDRQSGHVELIGSSSRRLERLISDILDYVDIDKASFKFKLAQFPLQTLINELRVRISREIETAKKPISFRVSVEPHLEALQLFSEKLLIERIVMYLADNAVKFTNEGEITLYVSEIDDSLRIGIQDTGVGVHPDFKQKIFEVFVQADARVERKFEGSGLGLAICKKMVEIIGGTLSFESELDKGSFFWIDIPLHTLVRKN